MKQLRLMAFAAMTLIMGVTMTSCFGSSEGDNKSTQDVIALYQNGTFEQIGGGILVPSSSSNLPSLPGIYSFTIEYDPTGWSDNKLNVTITSKPISLDNPNIRVGEATGNINLYELEYSGLKPEMFNQNYLLVPCMFWMDNVDEASYVREFDKHKFSLLVPEDLHNSEGILNLTLIDEVTDPELDRYSNSWQYQAFNLQSIITGFKSINGKINTIRIWGNTNRNSYDPAEERTVKRYVDIDLKPFQ
ncbi:MAG: hypothetical protein J6U14_06010 [Bacteroidaceae bacterium]|nr:hypothetical protein [Bacteroidaceae bacterium]